MVFLKYGWYNYRGESMTKTGFALCGTMLLAGLIALCPAELESSQFNDPEKVAEVLSGERDTAYVSWWGFDEEDSTEYILAALISGAKTVIIPNVGKDWVIRPVRLPRDNQEIVFEEGVVVSAKRDGSFESVTSQLISLYNRENVVLRGHGATLKMWKEDYQSEPYEPAEHRHALGLHISNNIKVLGLTMLDSGGDGIYIRRCEDIVIRDVICDGNRRQGISIIGAKNLLIEDAILRNTAGTNPQSGLDIEPHRDGLFMENVVIRNTISENNAGRGFIVNLGRLTSASDPVSVRFENCVARNNLEGISLMRFRDENSVKGTVEFVNTTSEWNRLSELAVRDTGADSPTELKFTDCTFRGRSQRSGVFYFGLEVRWERDRPVHNWGGLEFKDCVVEAHGERLFVDIKPEVMRRGGISDVKGNITLKSPHPQKVFTRELATILSQAGLTVDAFRTQ